MSGELVVQQAVLSTLRADAGIIALLPEHPYGGSPSVPAVFEYVQQADDSATTGPFPYIVVGDTTAIEFDTDDVNGQEHTVTLHVWDRNPGRKRCRQVVDAIYAALHKVDLSISGRAAIYCFFEFTESLPDPDVKLQHMVTRYRIVSQET